MEKFDGGNFHLWKFKMRMMLSKHGLWKFIDGSATLPSEEVARVDYNEKETKAFALLCEHLTDAQLAHIQYCDNVRSVWEAFCGVHEAKTIGNKLFLQRRFFTIKMQEGDDMLVHINMVKALADQLRSIEVNITDEDVYMALLMSLPPSFDNLVTSLESMSTKDVDLQFIIARLFHELSKRKECESSETTYRNPTLAKCGGEAQHFQSWGFGVLRDSQMFRAQQQGLKHLALRCSWCHWKGLEA